MPRDRTRPEPRPAGLRHDVRHLRDGLAAGRRPLGSSRQPADARHRIFCPLQPRLRRALRTVDRLYRTLQRLDRTRQHGARQAVGHLREALQPLREEERTAHALHQAGAGSAGEGPQARRGYSGTGNHHHLRPRRERRHEAASGVHLSRPRGCTAEARLRRVRAVAWQQGVDED